MSRNGNPRIDRGVLPAVFVVSFAVIAWQLGLMRCLLIARYHHFSFLVISCALLGFGASGTALTLMKGRLERHAGPVFMWGVLLFAISMPICFRVGEALPVSVQFSPVVLLPALGWWCAFWLLHLIPFFLAGMLIGLALITAGDRVNLVYACNLVGSAAGALGGIFFMAWVPPEGLVVPCSLLVLVSGLLLVPGASFRDGLAYSSSLLIAVALLVGAQVAGVERIFPLGIDQYKTLAHVQRLLTQGGAEESVSLYGRRGKIQIFSGPHFHTVLSLGPAVTPSRMDMVIRDGFHAGTIPIIDRDPEADFLRNMLSALPYKLIAPQKVLILGESGAIYVRLARLSAARSIVLVQPDENIILALRQHPTRPLDDPRVQVVRAEPRAFLDQNKDTFDIIQMAALEGFAPGSSGIGGLREDYLGTVEGFSRCLDALTERGLACVVRGIQDPPRDNIKIAATWIAAMERNHIPELGQCLLMARDELAFVTVAARSPLSPDLTAQFLRVCNEMSWDAEWFPAVRPEQTNRVHILPGPPGEEISWYNYAMTRLLSPEREGFLASWICNVRPAVDDQPFFHDFFRWASVDRPREAFGPLWPARAEMGFLVLVLALAWTGAVAAVLLPMPLLLSRRHRAAMRPGLTFWVTVYFGALGTGFMFLEMSLIQMFTRFLGDPILAAALVVAGFLFFAGVGSAIQPRLTSRIPAGILLVAVVIAGVVVCYSFLLPVVFQATAMTSETWKVIWGLVLLAPPAILMGNPFPWGLSVLHRRTPESVPFAWAVNGFTSVTATSLAVILAMAYGFKTLLGVSAFVYVLAGLASARFERSPRPAGRLRIDNGPSNERQDAGPTVRGH